MKKIVLILVIGLLLFLGCITEESKEPKETKETIPITDFSVDGSGSVTRDKVAKTAIVEMQVKLADIDEMEAVTMTTCSTYSQLFFNREYLQKLSDDMQKLIDEGNLDTVNLFESLINFPVDKYVKGYTVTEFNMQFIDKEDGTKIADCKVTGKESDDFSHTWHNTTTEEELENQRKQLIEKIENQRTH